MVECCCSVFWDWCSFVCNSAEFGVGMYAYLCKINNLLFYCGSHTGDDVDPLMFFVILELIRNKSYILSHWNIDSSEFVTSFLFVHMAPVDLGWLYYLGLILHTLELYSIRWSPLSPPWLCLKCCWRN